MESALRCQGELMRDPLSCGLLVISLVRACFSWQDNDILSAGRPLTVCLPVRLIQGESMTTTDPVHNESETHTWSVNVPDHPQRADSPEYTAAKNKMNEIAAQAAGLIYGPGPFQDHHGSALWLQDSQGWLMVRNLAGIEWSAQFCADPAKVDLLRQNAKRLYDLVAPQVKQELDPNGLLDTPITDADGFRSGPIRYSTPGSPCTKASTSASCRWVKRKPRVPPRQGTHRILPTPATRRRLLPRPGTRSLPVSTITPRPSSTSSCSSTTISSSG